MKKILILTPVISLLFFFTVLLKLAGCTTQDLYQ